MCVEPATLAMISMAASAVGSVTAAGGAADAANARASSDMYQAQVAANNKTIADQNATYEIQKGEQQAEIRGMQTGQQAGTARAIMGAGGVRVDSGSPLNVQGDIAGTGEMDVETIRNNAMKAAYGYKVQGMGFDAQAGLNTKQAGFDISAGQTNVMTSLISGASSVADKWSKFKTVGSFTDYPG